QYDGAHVWPDRPAVATCNSRRGDRVASLLLRLVTAGDGTKRQLGMSARLLPLPNEQPAPLVLIQLELLDGHGFSSLAVRRFDRADMFAFAAHDDDAPASPRTSSRLQG